MWSPTLGWSLWNFITWSSKRLTGYQTHMPTDYSVEKLPVSAWRLSTKTSPSATLRQKSHLEWSRSLLCKLITRLSFFGSWQRGDPGRTLLSSMLKRTSRIWSTFPTFQAQIPSRSTSKATTMQGTTGPPETSPSDKRSALFKKFNRISTKKKKEKLPIKEIIKFALAPNFQSRLNGW